MSSKEYNREYQFKNKEKIKKRRKEYRLKNKIKVKEQVKKSYLKNIKTIKEYRLKNKEYQKQYNKEYDLKNKERIKKRKKEYYLKNKEKQKEYRLKNKEKLKKQHKDYYLKNKEHLLELGKKNYLKNNKQKKEYQKQYSKGYFQKNKEYIYIRNSNRIKTDLNLKLRIICRSRVRSALKVKNAIKSLRTMKLIGCSPKKLWLHLEKNFLLGMTKENHGLWHIDHIMPCASFDLRCPVQQLACFNYKNLQPLWASDNMSKGAKII